MSTPLGAKLKAARERIGLSRSEVARHANIDAAMLFRIENADNSAPTFAVVCRLARVLNASLDWLAIVPDPVDQRYLGDSVVLTGRARLALGKAAQHLEIALSSLRVETDMGTESFSDSRKDDRKRQVASTKISGKKP